MGEYIGLTAGVVILSCYLFIRFRGLHRQLTESKTTEESTNQKITFRDGFLIAVLSLAYCFFTLGTLKLVWGNQMTWEEVVIGAPIMWVVGFMALYLHKRSK